VKAGTALQELAAVMELIDESKIDNACELISRANKIVLYGCGREGLQVSGFAMRLHHLGLSVAMQGDMAAPPIGKGDLFLTSAGPGELSTVTALMRVAHASGATVVFMTAEPDAPGATLADFVLTIPAQTMARDQELEAQSQLPMGSIYEGALFLLFEIMVLKLRQILNVSPETMRANHTNME